MNDLSKFKKESNITITKPNNNNIKDKEKKFNIDAIKPALTTLLMTGKFPDKKEIISLIVKLFVANASDKVLLITALLNILILLVIVAAVWKFIEWIILFSQWIMLLF